jgi:hypothetical protein
VKEKWRRIHAWVKEKGRCILVWLGKTFDLNDVFVFAGLAAACYGVAQIDPPSAWIVGGVTLVWLGKFK